jgi:hypothetical protein
MRKQQLKTENVFCPTLSLLFCLCLFLFYKSICLILLGFVMSDSLLMKDLINWHVMASYDKVRLVATLNGSDQPYNILSELLNNYLPTTDYV